MSAFQNLLAFQRMKQARDDRNYQLQVERPRQQREWDQQDQRFTLQQQATQQGMDLATAAEKRAQEEALRQQQQHELNSGVIKSAEERAADSYAFDKQKRELPLVINRELAKVYNDPYGIGQDIADVPLIGLPSVTDVRKQAFPNLDPELIQKRLVAIAQANGVSVPEIARQWNEHAQASGAAPYVPPSPFSGQTETVVSLGPDGKPSVQYTSVPTPPSVLPSVFDSAGNIVGLRDGKNLVPLSATGAKPSEGQLAMSSNVSAALRNLDELKNLVDKNGNFEVLDGAANAKMQQLVYDTAVAYAKIVDPGSVAREGEVASALKYMVPMGLFTRNGTTLAAIDNMQKMIRDRAESYEVGAGKPIPGLPHKSTTPKTTADQLPNLAPGQTYLLPGGVTVRVKNEASPPRQGAAPSVSLPPLQMQKREVERAVQAPTTLDFGGPQTQAIVQQAFRAQERRDAMDQASQNRKENLAAGEQALSKEVTELLRNSKWGVRARELDMLDNGRDFKSPRLPAFKNLNELLYFIKMQRREGNDDPVFDVILRRVQAENQRLAPLRK